MKIGILAVQGKLLRELDMFDTLKMQIEQGKPVLATCAGLILLAKNNVGYANIIKLTSIAWCKGRYVYE